MARFDKQYILLEQLYEDSFYPQYMLDKIKLMLLDFIFYIEENPTGITDVGNKIFELVEEVKSMQDEFIAEESEFDALAKETLLRDIEYIIKWYHLPVNLEKELTKREWE